jgi:hypothetical protein
MYMTEATVFLRLWIFSVEIITKDILFVYGDNDTYPVWAIQETERFRDDVKVVNFTLASTPWNLIR